MSNADNAFFEELKAEFLTETAFMFEQYEESMLGLETGNDPQGDLAKIFRVAHSIKGGAAAVGFPDLSMFAHIVEDLLAFLRTDPSHVNSNIISLLLRSGDVLKNRIQSLQKGEDLPWNTTDLENELKSVLKSLGVESSGHGSTEEAHVAPVAAAPAPSPAPAPAPVAAVEEDHTNYELLAEIEAQLGMQSTPSPVEIPEIDLPDLESQKVEAELAAELEAALADHVPAAAAPVAPTAPVEQAQPQPQSQAEVIEFPKAEEKKPAAAPVAEPVPAKAQKIEPQAKSGGGSGGSGKPTATSIKVDTGRVDSVLDAVGELVVLKNQIVHDEVIRNSGNVRLVAIVDQLDKSVRELYDKTLSIRLTPLKSLFLKIQRIVRDLSLNLNKPIDLQLLGEETEVERTVFELLGDPLVHLVRNAMDHGIETPDVRAAKGKPPVAKLTVSARQTGGTVTIEIIDDGGGVNREKVLKKAIDKGLVSPGVDPATIPDEQVFQFLFAPGFSTADKVTDLSGRGVGLDVVKSNLQSINGKIDIRSKMGVGTTFRLSIPLSTAITDGIVVAIQSSKYILPIYSIREIVRAVPSDYTNISGAGKVVKIRDILLPVIDIQKTIGRINWAQLENMKYELNSDKESLRSRREETMLIIIESLHGMMAMPVDDVIGQAQVVVKAINTGQSIPEVAGAAILGDGRTVLVLDPAALTQMRHTEEVQGRAA